MSTWRRWRVTTPIVLSAVLFGSPSPADADTGPVAWVMPSAESGVLTAESSFEGVSLSVELAKTGEAVNTRSDLYQHGWAVSPGGLLRSRMDGFYETIPLFDEMGQPLEITVSGLYPGVQRVSVQYFAEPFAHGSTWSSRSQARLEGQKMWASLNYNEGRVVRGLGGTDQSTIYEQTIGTVGTADEPADAVTLTIKKAKWSKRATIAGIRIDTAPDMDAALTRMDREAESRIREALADRGPRGDDGRLAYHAAVLPSAVKVKPKSFAALKPDWLGDEADIAAARNEHESFQVLIYHPDEPLNDVTWSVEELTGPSKSAAAKIEVEVAPIGYVEQRRSPYTVDHWGYIADPLLTFTDAVSVQPGDAQTFWVRCSVPAEAEPGTYRGVVAIQPQGMPGHRVPFTLKVWDVVLPEMPHLPVVVGVRESDNYAFEMEYGINPTSIYQGEGVWGLPTEELMPMLRDWAERGVSAVNTRYVTYRHGAMPTDEQVAERVDQIERFYSLAKQAGLGEEAYVYLFDEAKPADYPAMKKVADAIKARMPDLRLMTTAYGGPDRSFGADADVPIDIWVPIVQHFRDADLVEKGAARGREIWWYTCNYPRSPMPNILLDNAAMETRMMMGVMAHAYHVGGFLYYKTNNWRGRKPITDGPYTGWVSRRGYSHGNWYQMGPSGAPLPSIRLEVFRDGLEDYDLIELALRKHRAEGGSAGGIGELLAPMNEVPNPYVSSVLDYNRDPRALDKLRRELAAYLTRHEGPRADAATDSP